MAITINQYNCAGNLTRDIELRHGAEGGTAYATCGIAITERAKKGTEYVDETQFYDFTMFGKLAERCAQHLKKGDTVYISGRLKQERWEDKDTKKQRVAVKIIAQDVVFIKWGRDRKPAEGGSAEGQPDAGEMAPF